MFMFVYEGSLTKCLRALQDIQTNCNEGVGPFVHYCKPQHSALSGLWQRRTVLGVTGSWFSRRKFVGHVLNCNSFPEDHFSNCQEINIWRRSSRFKYVILICTISHGAVISWMFSKICRPLCRLSICSLGVSGEPSLQIQSRRLGSLPLRERTLLTPRHLIQRSIHRGSNPALTCTSTLGCRQKGAPTCSNPKFISMMAPQDRDILPNEYVESSTRKA